MWVNFNSFVFQIYLYKMFSIQAENSFGEIQSPCLSPLPSLKMSESSSKRKKAYVFQDVNVDLFDSLTFNGFENCRNFDRVKSFSIIHKGDAEGHVVLVGAWLVDGQLLNIHFETLFAFLVDSYLAVWIIYWIWFWCKVCRVHSPNWLVGSLLGLIKNLNYTKNFIGISNRLLFRNVITE